MPQVPIWVCVLIAVLAAAVCGAVAFFAGVNHRKREAEAAIGSAEDEAKRIISNAIKYTGSDGKIYVTSGKMYDSVYIKIKDNGIGIPKEDLPHIFERFYRVDKARSREKGGTGLGLAISHDIIAAHGGSIKINSIYGAGTEVVIILPTEKNSKKTRK